MIDAENEVSSKKCCVKRLLGGGSLIWRDANKFKVKGATNALENNI